MLRSRLPLSGAGVKGFGARLELGSVSPKRTVFHFKNARMTIFRGLWCQAPPPSVIDLSRCLPGRARPGRADPRTRAPPWVQKKPCHHVITSELCASAELNRGTIFHSKTASLSCRRSEPAVARAPTSGSAREALVSVRKELALSGMKYGC